MCYRTVQRKTGTILLDYFQATRLTFIIVHTLNSHCRGKSIWAMCNFNLNSTAVKIGMLPVKSCKLLRLRHMIWQFFFFTRFVVLGKFTTVRTNAPFRILTMELSKEPLVFHNHICTTLIMSLPECIVKPERNDYLNPTMKNNYVHHRKKKFCRGESSFMIRWNMKKPV